MRKNFYVFILLCLISACRNEPVRREYQESVSPASSQQRELPPGHPSMEDMKMSGDMTASSELPPGHPPINNLPEGHPPVQGMVMNDPSMKAMISNSVVQAPVTWVAPEGWQEIPGDGMRLATLKSPDGRVQISISSFAGSAGGVEGNVARWLGQLKIALDDDTLKAFIDQSESVVSTGGLSVRIFRFTSLNPDADSSMIAAMTDVSGSTLFLKMTGAPADLENHFVDFHDFCQSLELKS